MIAYITIIAICTILICLLNCVLGSACFVENGTEKTIFIVLLAVLGVFVIDLIISLIVTLLPSKVFRPFRKIYPFEKKFYEKLGIKKWKDYLPIGKGPLFIGMDKSHVECNSSQYLLKLIDECFKAEIMHFFSMFVGYLVILLFPLEYCLSVTLPVAVVNMCLQYPTFIVQRYNLPKLEILLRRAIRSENRANER